MSQSITAALSWHRVLAPDELPGGRVKTVAAGHHSLAMVHLDGQYAALSKRCPHQGGPLGEGSIEKGMLRCPWHGYDYCPPTGASQDGDSVPTLWGEIGVTVRLIADRLGPAPAHRADQRPELAERWAIWRTEKLSRERDDRGRDDHGRGVSSAAVFAALTRCAPSGQSSPSTSATTLTRSLYFECRPGQSVLMSGYLGSVGFGYPAAIGARAAAHDRPILAVTGDGGFAQYTAELLTAVQHDMKITHVLLNSGQLGKISKEQHAGDWDVWQTSLHNPDFSKYAEISHALGIPVTAADQLDDALSAASGHAGPALIEVMTDPELVY